MSRRALSFINWYGPDPSEDELIGLEDVCKSRIYYPPSCRVWLVAVPYLESPSFDLAIRMAPVAGQIGKRPKWWGEFECSGYTDAEYFLEMPRMDLDVRHAANVMTWLMHEGIAPGQPFQVAVAKPYWYRCSYEYDEHDANYYAELVSVAPLDLEEGRRRWARYLRRREKAIGDYEARMDAERQRALTDASALTVRKDWWYVGDPQFGRLGGYIARLYSRHGTRLIAQARDDGDPPERYREKARQPSWDVAFERLIADAAQHAPAFTPEVIRAVPIRH